MSLIARCVLAPAFLLAAVGPAHAAPRRHDPPARCARGHRHRLAADAQAQVYRTAGPIGQGGEGPFVFGCAYGHRGAYLLGALAMCRADKYMFVFCGGVDREVLAGPVVAYELIANPSGCGFCHWAVRVSDLRSGRLLRDEPTGTPVRAALMENFGVGPTTAIVLKSDGSVAWIADARAAQGRPAEGGYQVHAADRSGSRVLASGEGVDPSSLALAGSTLYWTQDGEPRSASLN